MSKLLQRVVTAAILVAALAALLLAAPRGIALAGTALMMLPAAWEWSAFVGASSRAAKALYVTLIAAALAVAFLLVPEPVPLRPVLLVALAWWAGAFLWILAWPTRVPAWLAGLAGILVLVPAWISAAALLRIGPDGPRLLLLALAIVWAADIGAYFAGRRLGHRRLAPLVSPGKTWEGLAGGLVAAFGVGLLGGALLGLPALPLGFTGLAVGAISVVGDLTESLFKRHAGLKDSGTLFPGHGGMLDRIDSVTAALPLFVFLMRWPELASP